MAHGIKTGGRDIKKGEILNPTGRPKLPEDVKILRDYNKIEIERRLSKYIYMSKDELKASSIDPLTEALDLMIIGTIIQSATKGCPSRFNFILDRLIGKVATRIEAIAENPFHERLALIPPSAIGDEIERLLEKRKIIEEETGDAI